MKFFRKCYLCFLPSVLLAQSGWVIQSPTVPVCTYFDVKFIDSSLGIAVGDHGTIIRTTDGGTTWQVVQSGVESGLRCLSFIDHNTVVAGGDSGTILRSSDAGISWSKQASCPNYYIWSVSFLSSGVGSAIGGWNDTSFIMSTVDRGITWSIVAGLKGAGTPSISMADSMHRIAVFGESILLSTDGGARWIHISTYSINFYSTCVRYLDSSTIVVVGGRWSPPYAMVLRSTDGGSTWSEHLLDSIPYHYVSISSENSLHAVVAGMGAISTTTDGGITWKGHTTAWEFYGVSFRTQSSAVAVGGGGLIARSDDSCFTWSRFERKIEASLFGVASLKHHSWICIGAAGTILKTTNDGVDWQTRPSGTTLTLNSVSFPDSLHGTVVGGDEGYGPGVILHTTDGGDSWSTQWIDSTIYTFYSTSFVGPLDGIVVGRWGGTLTTSDGGTTWIRRWNGSTSPLYGVSLANKNIGIAVGDDGTALKTTDGGQNWIRLDLHTTRMKGVCLLDSLNAVVVGDLLVFSSDGGQSWFSTYAIDPLPTLSAVAFADPLTITGVGDRIINTNDGGVTWTIQNVASHAYPPAQLTAVAFSDPRRIMTVGLCGTILFTTTGGQVSSVSSKRTSTIPASITLDQNYPNPFNPSTTIEYRLSCEGAVTLRVVDLMGREAAVLTNDRKSAGAHTATWNASGFSSGIYFLQLRVVPNSRVSGKEAYVQTKKLILLK